MEKKVATQDSGVDRRIHPRFDLEQSASVLSSTWISAQPVEGNICDISVTGISLELAEPIPLGDNLSIFLPLPLVDKPLQVLGRVIWSRSRENSSIIHGITFSETLVNKEIFLDFVSALAKLKKPRDRRLTNADRHEYPLKNRQTDYGVLSHDSPYVNFFQLLQQEASGKQIDTIVLSNSLAYLQKRIRRAVSDYPRITLASDFKRRAHGNTLVILNLECRRKHEAFTLLDFDEYKLKCSGISDPLSTLNRVSENIDEEDEVTVLSLGAVRDQKIAQKYFQVARFENIKWYSERRLTAKKRKLLNQQINCGSLILRETQSSADIHRFQEFSSHFYSAGYNFKKDIDAVFSDYSHFYLVEKVGTNEIITGARVTWHLPGLYLPCMLALKEGTEDHIQLQDPDNLSYGEIYAPYFSSMTALKAYGELVRRFIYYTEEKFIDAYLTTHNKEKMAESKFLSQYLGFKETNVVLKYGDFGGLWNLIYLTQHNLDKNIQINFSSPESSPRFVNTFRNH